MTTPKTELQVAAVEAVLVTHDDLIAKLTDGRTIPVALAWYPRLVNGTPEERNNWRLIGSGEGIHWPDLDKDISADDLIASRSSGESERSLESWLQRRTSTTRLQGRISKTQ